MIEQIRKIVTILELLSVGIPYLSIRIEPGRIEMQVPQDAFDKIIDDVDLNLILTWPNNSEKYPIERSILIGTVRVFALYEE